MTAPFDHSRRDVGGDALGIEAANPPILVRQAGVRLDDVGTQDRQADRSVIGFDRLEREHGISSVVLRSIHTDDVQRLQRGFRLRHRDDRHGRLDDPGDVTHSLTLE